MTETLKRPLRRLVHTLMMKPAVDWLLKSWRPTVAPDLAKGTDEGILAYYNSRVTDCTFLLDATHYERPRIEWILEKVQGGIVLEIGCGNGGLTRLLASQVERIVALDISEQSLRELAALGLSNVQPMHQLIERFQPSERFDWIVMSEVVEHLRDPEPILRRCVAWLKPTGSLLLSTPNGPWESIEHLHEFTLSTFCDVLGRSGAKRLEVFYIQDEQGMDRWLAAQLRPVVSAVPLSSLHHIQEPAG